MRIGVIIEKPWAYPGANGSSAGIEGELAKGFAGSLGVEAEWKFVSEREALEGLEDKRFDLVIGGLRDTNPGKKSVGLTRPYIETEEDGGKKAAHVMAVPPGENRWLSELERFLAGADLPAADLPPGAHRP